MHWFVTTNNLDLKNRPFYPASKFNVDVESPLIEPNNYLDFINSTNDDLTHSSNIQYASFSQQQLYYAKIHGCLQEL